MSALSRAFKSALPPLGLLLASLLISLLAAEVLARLFFPHAPAAVQASKILVHEASDNLKLLYKPSPGMANQAYGVWNRINSAGFRDREFDRQKPAAVKRIVFLGDSVVYGYGIESEGTIPKQLEKIFRENGQPVEVLNFGVSGYETEQSVEFFKTAALAFQPDLVIVGYTLNDSIYASMELDFFHDQLGRRVRVERKEFRKRFWGFLFSHSRLMSLLDERLHLQKRFKRFRSYEDKDIWHYIEDRNIANKDPEDSPYQRLRGAIEQEALAKGTSAKGLRSMLGFLGIGNDPFYASHWNVSRKALLELTRLSRDNGFSVAAVLFPYMAEPQHYALAPAHDFLKAEFSGMGIRNLEVRSEVFEAWKREGNAAIMNDPIHFTARGCEVVAKALYEQIKDSL